MSIRREQLLEKFQAEYAHLNEEQKKAVDTIEGPVMVIAGPGTGKTQILASRIGKILLETDSLPQNILCLTYTEAGVVAMRKRLQRFIGSDAYKVNIYTFHAFCNDIIQENLSLFEKTALDPVSDLERIEMFTQLIDAFPKAHPLKRYRGDVYFEIKNLQSLFSTMKREGWTSAFITEKIDEYLKELPNRDGFTYKRAYKQFKAGDLNQNRIDEENEKMEKLRAAVMEFDNFQQLMRARNRYDFDDMINWVIRSFEENKNLLARYQEQFLYILVDEYQDTSGTQNRLVELLLSFWDTPNIFVVGDDDQSIYRFQGANVENMLSLAHTYKDDLLKVVLTKNYRSTQPILNVAQSLINRNNERLIRQIPGLTKELRASHPEMMALEHMPSIKEYESQRQEMIGITKEIKTLLLQGVQPGRISVIYKENKYGEELTTYLLLQNIPVYSKRNINILELPLVHKLMLLLRYLATEHDIPYSGDEMLFEILHFDWFNIHPIEIAKLSSEVADKQYTSEKISLRRLLFERTSRPPKDLFTVAPDPHLKQASMILEKLVRGVSNLTLQQMFELIIREAGVLARVMESEEKIWELQVITGLFDFVQEERRRQPNMSVQQFVNTIDLMEREGLPLPLVRVSGSDKGVNLLTAHGSKGLEFEHVFIAGANAAFWEKKRKPGGGYKLPDTIFTATSQSTVKEESGDDEELRRLFYVALTRAEQYLTISYSRFKSDGRELEPSMFIAEILEHHDIPVEKVFVDDEVQAEFQALSLSRNAAPEIGELEEGFIAERLSAFVMNLTALNNYLKCPLEFYFKNLVRIPAPKNENTEFGSAVHHALEQFFRKMKANGEQFPLKEVFLEDFKWYMNRHRESFTREQFERRFEYGLEVLSNYYDEYIFRWSKVVTIEQNIRNVVVAGVPLKGKLDKMEFDGKKVNVVDYKTGDPDKNSDKFLRFGEKPDKSPHGGDYWRQAVFYKLLVDNYDKKEWTVVSTEFDFIEPSKKRKGYHKETVTIRPEDITTVTQQIRSVWDKIHARDFYTGCGKEDCHWCNFVKTNNLAIALHELKTEDELE